ncbi:sugar ABC transporter permease [Vallitalea longa]|uniref:Sugar ABC transporter permease n=1 Tax=Vallitalea longa TaxID=2936439 RepID=A0A9W5YBY6_9FIRM|nr:carbohydrate ABC transporter permease [Vallitalea longa]GKX31195.1 sugar ABC transporter permease [Vallitalea longa]
MASKKITKKKKKKIIVSVLGVILALVYISPFYMLLSNSFKTSKGIFKEIFALPFGKYFTLENYVNAFREMDFIKSFTNSLLITIVGTSLIVITSAMAAWVLVRYKSKTSTLIFFGFAGAVLVPFQCVMLPLVKFMGKLNMLNIPGLIVMYIGFGSSMAIMFFHGFIKNVPIALEEAAIIDGCGPFRVFWRIVLPLMKPIVFTIVILDVMWLWNDFLLPSLIINQPGMHTIPLKTYYFFGKYTKRWDLATAALVISIIPIMIFYAFAQKRVINGITEGAVK